MTDIENNAKFASKKIRPLVLGGTGMIGSNVCLKLIDRGYNVSATYHTRKPLIWHKSIDYVQTDLSNVDECERVMTGYEVVFVCSAYKFSASAAREVSTKLYKNIQMSINILEAARRTGVKKIILLSSVTAYQKIEGEISEMQYFSDDTMQNVSVYGLSKRLTEFLSRIYEKETNFKTVVVRPSAVYGPYDDFNLKTSYVMSALIRKVIDGHNPIEVWGTGNERRNFIYVGDLAEAMVTAMEKIDGIESFNIASSTSISIKELIYKIVDICGSNDVEILFNTSCPSSNAIHNVSIEKAKNMLGFVPETSIEEGIKKTAEWYISNKELFK